MDGINRLDFNFQNIQIQSVNFIVLKLKFKDSQCFFLQKNENYPVHIGWVQLDEIENSQDKLLNWIIDTPSPPDSVLGWNILSDCFIFLHLRSDQITKGMPVPFHEVFLPHEHCWAGPCPGNFAIIDSLRFTHTSEIERRFYCFLFHEKGLYFLGFESRIGSFTPTRSRALILRVRGSHTDFGNSIVKRNNFFQFRTIFIRTDVPGIMAIWCFTSCKWISYPET